MRKLYVFLGVCVLALGMQGSCLAEVRADECEGAKQENVCIHDEEVDNAVNMVEDFLRALKKGDYAKAWECIDDETKNYLVVEYRNFFPDFCQEHKVYANNVALDFPKGGFLARKYWVEMYKRDCQFDKINFSDYEYRGERTGNGITVKIMDGNWAHSWYLLPDEGGNYMITIPRG